MTVKISVLAKDAAVLDDVVDESQQVIEPKDERPLLAVSYENVAAHNPEFWTKFFANAEKYGYRTMLVCENDVQEYDLKHSTVMCVSRKTIAVEQLEVLAEFGDHPQVWIDKPPFIYANASNLKS